MVAGSRKRTWWLATIGLAATCATASMEVGFCRSDGSGFLATQPADQLERWVLPVDNGSHLIIDWRADASVCSRNVSEYMVSVQTSMPVLNFFTSIFGSFPQDICAEGGSMAREAVNVQEPGSSSSCSPYPRFCSGKVQRTTFEVPSVLRQLARANIEVTVRAYGAHAPAGHPERAQACSWWCHKYRKQPQGSDPGPDPPSSPGARQSWRTIWLQWRRRLGDIRQRFWPGLSSSQPRHARK